MIASSTIQGHILVVDDDDEIRDILQTLLASENFNVSTAASPSEALEKMNPGVDLIILDISLPEMSGYELCQKIRRDSNVPILFLTARSGNSDLVMGYASGGDDYLAKPFSYSELIARVKGLLRRYTVYKGRNTPKRKEEYIHYGNIKIDCTNNRVWKDSCEIELTDTEYRILKLLMTYPGQLFTIQNIYETLWEEEYLPSSSNTVMVFIRKIREKIEDDPKNPQLLVTVWGRGYKIA